MIYSAAGAVHAIGAGITLIEVQQNVDLTYRLYDYGRPRELHLEAGIAVSDTAPYVPPTVVGDIGGGREILCEGGKFVLERWSWTGERQIALPDGISGWLVPVTGSGHIDHRSYAAGECWMLDGDTQLHNQGVVLFTYPGRERLSLLS